MNKIAIFSVPRSGSTWLGQIFNSSPHVTYRFQPNFAYSFPEHLTENASRAEILNFYDRLLNTDDPFVNAEISISSRKNIQFDKQEIKALVFKETHYLHVIENLLENSDTKVIGLVRSPFATINSWLNTPKEFHPGWNIEEEWVLAPSKNKGKKENYFGYQKWKEVTDLFFRLKDQYPERFLCVSYEDLLEDTKGQIKIIFDFCQLPFTKQTETFIEQASKKNEEDPYSVFKKKSKDDQWKTSLPNFIKKEILEDEGFKELNKVFKWI